MIISVEHILKVLVQYITVFIVMGLLQTLHFVLVSFGRREAFMYHATTVHVYVGVEEVGLEVGGVLSSQEVSDCFGVSISCFYIRQKSTPC